MTRRAHAHPSDANAIGDLFADFEEPPKILAPIHAFTEPAKPKMPDRGYLYSEEHRKLCELRHIRQLSQEKSAYEMNNWWNLVEKSRGAQARYDLQREFDDFVRNRRPA